MKLLHASFLSLALLLATVRSAPHGNSTEIAEAEHNGEYDFTHDLYDREADAEDVSGFDDDEDTDELIAGGVEDLDEPVDDDDLDLDEDDVDEHELASRDFDEDLDTEVEELDDEFDFGHELTAREAAYELEGFDEEDSVLQTRAASGHMFYFVNKCKSAVQPAFADTRCGYSPRCGDASSYKSKQPGVLKPGKTSKYRVPNKWVGRVFNKRNKRCGRKGENCTMGEFNLDTGSQWTPQAYDISNIQGFTQSMAIKGEGGAQVTCRSVKCSCNQAYPPGDMAGKCGTNAVDQPVRACGKGGKAFRVTFCP